MIRLNPGAELEILLGESQRTRPRADFDGEAINQGQDVQPAQHRPTARHQPAQNDPQDPEQVHRQSSYREYSVRTHSPVILVRPHDTGFYYFAGAKNEQNAGLTVRAAMRNSFRAFSNLSLCVDLTASTT